MWVAAHRGEETRKIAHESENSGDFPSAVLVAAFIATGLISLAPNLILLLCPAYASGEAQSSRWLSYAQCLAAG
jgi:hypothetical protein